MSYRKYLMADDVPPSELYKTVKIDTDSDTISRQAVLVAVKDALMAWSYMPEWRDEKILEAIAELPPAQALIRRTSAMTAPDMRAQR